MKKRKQRTLPCCSVVATAHTAGGLRQAASLRPADGVDFVEIRLDCLNGSNDRLRQSIEKIKLPIILTARHPREGGAGALDSRRREELLTDFLPLASLVDIELRSVRSLCSVVTEANRRRIGVIVSLHDFSGTPSPARLHAKVHEASKAGASIIKIATFLRGPRDLASLLLLQSRSNRLATMGMGSLGKVSRLALPLAGARLVYGYLDRPQVEGQWPAPKLAARIAELLR